MKKNHNSLSVRKQKIYSMAAVISGTVTTFMTKCKLAYCTGLFDNKVEVNVGEMDPNALVGNVLTVIAGVSTLVGIFIIAKGISKYLEAKDEGNSAGESKAATSIGIGLAFCVMPWIFNLIFG